MMCILFLTLIFNSSIFADVTWEQQAERLQQVNAALLDNVPIAEPLRGNRYLDVRANVMLLPKVNATIGGKSESVPSAPAHMVPTAVFNHVPLDGAIDLGYRLYAGYLPAGTEKIFKLDAKLSQYTLGGALLLRKKMSDVSFGLSLGYHLTSAQLSGAITSPGASDKYACTTSILNVGLQSKFEKLNLWYSFLYGARSSSSRLNIAEDATQFDVKDNSPVYQAAIGYDFGSGLQFGVGEEYIPNRLFAARLIGAYAFNF